jgi:beta-glucosidase
MPDGAVSVASDGKETVDRKGIDLEQEALVREVYAANKHTVMVLKASSFAINWSDHVPAILTLAHSSQEEGTRWPTSLRRNPAGRLVHVPKSAMQLPPMMDYDIRHGRTACAKDPLYPFGFGLSTTFRYGTLRRAAPVGPTAKWPSASK